MKHILGIWACMYFHKMMFNIDLPYGKAKQFVGLQWYILRLVALPKEALDIGLITRALKMEEILQHR